MDTVLRKPTATGKEKRRVAANGFTLVETLIAIIVLAIAAVGLASMLGNALSYMQGSQNDFIAKQKAEEALEAIFTAKYDNTITYAQIANTSATPPGIFLTGPQSLRQPATNGLVGTTNDATATPDYIIMPGPDGLLGTADDINVPLTNFKRTITITATATNNLKQVVVTITYPAGQATRSYTMETYISAFQ